MQAESATCTVRCMVVVVTAKKSEWNKFLSAESHGSVNQAYLQVKNKGQKISLVLVRGNAQHESATAGQWKCHVIANVM